MATTTTKHILVVGLGNYTHPRTRHSVGMMVVDSIAQRFNVPWTKKGAWEAEIATATTTITTKTKAPKIKNRPQTPPITTNTTAADQRTLSEGTPAPALVPLPRPPAEIHTLKLTMTLLKPLQLMNVSGTSVSRAARDLGIKPTEILVIHDDMERELGKLSFKNEGSSNGHNGIKSCIKHLHTQHFRRLRVGIGRPPVSDRSPRTVAEFVLARFKPLEVTKLEEDVFDQAGDEILRVTSVPSTPPKDRKP